MVEPWPIEIDGLPFLKMVDLSMAMFNNQMVYSIVLSHVAKISERWEISTYFLSMEPLFFFPYINWRFPKIWVPPNHPFIDGIFHEINPPAIGLTPILWKPPIVIQESAQTQTLFVIAFIGSLDDLTLFVPMLVGKGCLTMTRAGTGGATGKLHQMLLSCAIDIYIYLNV